MSDQNSQNSFPDQLRWQLRALRQDQAPTTDLWPGIADRLQPRDVRPRRQSRWAGGLALAASLLLVVGTAVWLKPGQMDPSGQATDTGSDLADAGLREGLMLTEAEHMSREYQAAVRELDTQPLPPALAPTLDELDRNAGIVLDALRQDPTSPRLLKQLRRTYERRIELMRRAYT
jgi:hypothetical protein